MRPLQLLIVALFVFSARADSVRLGGFYCSRDFPSQLYLVSGKGALLTGLGSSCDLTIVPGEATEVSLVSHFILQHSGAFDKTFFADITVTALLPATFNEVDPYTKEFVDVGVHYSITGSYCAPFGCGDFERAGPGIGLVFNFTSDPKFCSARSGEACLSSALVTTPEPSTLLLLGSAFAAYCAVRRFRLRK